MVYWRVWVCVGGGGKQQASRVVPFGVGGVIHHDAETVPGGEVILPQGGGVPGKPRHCLPGSGSGAAEDRIVAGSAATVHGIAGAGVSGGVGLHRCSHPLKRWYGGDAQPRVPEGCAGTGGGGVAEEDGGPAAAASDRAGVGRVVGSRAPVAIPPLAPRPGNIMQNLGT